CECFPSSQEEIEPRHDSFLSALLLSELFLLLAVRRARSIGVSLNAGDELGHIDLALCLRSFHRAVALKTLNLSDTAAPAPRIKNTPHRPLKRLCSLGRLS